jgi:hypothetical protein
MADISFTKEEMVRYRIDKRRRRMDPSRLRWALVVACDQYGRPDAWGELALSHHLTSDEQEQVKPLLELLRRR